MHVRGERSVPKGIPQRSSSSVYRMSSIRSAALFFLNELMIVRIRSTVSRAIMLLPMLTCELLWSNRRPLCGTKPVKQGARKDGFVSKSRHVALPVRARWYIRDGGGRGPGRQHGHGRPIVKSLPLCRLSRAHNPAGRRCGTRVAPGCVRGGGGRDRARAGVWRWLHCVVCGTHRRPQQGLLLVRKATRPDAAGDRAHCPKRYTAQALHGASLPRACPVARP